MKSFFSWRKHFVVIILVLFIVENCLWCYFRFCLFGPFLRITKDNRFPEEHISIRNGTTYSISNISYLNFRGNLAIFKENDSGLIVWLHIFKPVQYGFSFVGTNGREYQVMIDDSCNLIDGNDLPDSVVKQYYTHLKDVEELFYKFKAWKEASQKEDRNYFDLETRQ